MLVAALVMAFSAEARSQSKIEETLQNLVRQMTDAQMAYDAAALDKLFAADYVEISPVGELDDRQKVLGFYQPGSKPPAGSPVPKLSITETTTRSHGDHAIMITRFNYTFAGAPASAARSMRVMLVFRKEKGSWKIASAQYTGIRQAPK